MLTTIAVILIILWLIGFLGFHILGSFIHVLLVIAIVMFLIRVIRGENPLK
ncbi:MAG: lmo0937 family membrane protein [bacterium]|nr:lmo0937 family membrane protein [bacterium]